MGKLAILEMVLFNELLNKWRATEGVVDVFKWWISTNSEFTKQWVDLELIRAQNEILLRWSWPRIKGEVRKTKSKWGLERTDALSQIRLVAAQGSSMQPSVCAEFWGLLSIFSKDFSEAAARESAVAKAPQPLGVTVVCFLGQKSSLWSPALQ